jgi:hypothetical protein
MTTTTITPDPSREIPRYLNPPGRQVHTRGAPRCGVCGELTTAAVCCGRVMPRYYTPGLLGRPCPFCGLPVPKALQAANHHAHPTCGPSELDLL